MPTVFPLLLGQTHPVLVPCLRGCAMQRPTPGPVARPVMLESTLHLPTPVPMSDL